MSKEIFQLLQDLKKFEPNRFVEVQCDCQDNDSKVGLVVSTADGKEEGFIEL